MARFRASTLIAVRSSSTSTVCSGASSFCIMHLALSCGLFREGANQQGGARISLAEYLSEPNARIQSPEEQPDHCEFNQTFTGHSLTAGMAEMPERTAEKRRSNAPAVSQSASTSGPTPSPSGRGRVRRPGVRVYVLTDDTVGHARRPCT